MSRVIITERAVQGLEQCRQFVIETNPQTAMRAGKAIKSQFDLLEAEPKIGRPLDDFWICVDSSFLLEEQVRSTLPSDEKSKDSVYILAFRHQKTAGY